MSRAKLKDADPITYLQIHNLLPILGIIVSAVSVFYLLQSKVQVQEQKIEYLNNAVTTCFNRVDSLELRDNAQSLDIKELQTKGEVKGVSTVRPRVTPTPDEKEVDQP